MNNKIIMCFAAHPDDLEFSSTVTLHKLKSKGFSLVYVIVTNGENGFKVGPEVSKEQRIRIRKQEQTEAAKKNGVLDLLFLDYRDGFLEYTEKLRKQLVDLIRKYKPELIFSFDPANRSYKNLNVAHRDHRVVSEVVLDACFAAKNDFMYAGTPHRVSQLYLYASENPDYFEDISELMEFKLDLLACHQSQFPDFDKVTQFVKEEICSQTEQYEFSEAFRILEIKKIT
jgi:LmbE family N-acetylglucosaminyl deacetylase